MSLASSIGFRINRFLTRFGYEVVPRWRFEVVPRWRLEKLAQANYLRQLFDHLNITCVLDVGANDGGFKDFLRLNVGYAGRIISFEPNLELAHSIEVMSAEDPLWDTKPIGLGACVGRVDLNIMAGSQFSSILKPSSAHTTKFSSRNKIVRKETVAISTLDVEWSEFGLQDENVYLKLDTQGYDLECLKGADRCLEYILGLQTEASVVPIYDGAPDYRTVMDFCSERGFVLSGIFPNNPGHFPVMIEFDCHMISRLKVTDSSC